MEATAIHDLDAPHCYRRHRFEVADSYSPNGIFTVAMICTVRHGGRTARSCASTVPTMTSAHANISSPASRPPGVVG